MYIKALVKAAANKDFVSFRDGRYHIMTREPAKDGRANAAAKSLLAEYLGIPISALSLVRGAQKPAKLFLQRGE